MDFCSPLWRLLALMKLCFFKQLPRLLSSEKQGEKHKLLRLHLGAERDFLQFQMIQMKVNDIKAKSVSRNETINLQKGNKKST